MSENLCFDCGGTPRARGQVEWEDDQGTHITPCTSSFHKIVKREAAAYEYLNEKLEAIHTTSVPMTDQEALDYFSIVAVWFPDCPPKYIMRKAFDSHKFDMMPWTYDYDTEEVSPIVRR